MTKKTASGTPMADRIEAWLADIRDRDTARFAQVSELRRIILACGPPITEEIKYGGLLFASAQPFCGIFVYRHHISLEFSEGAKLADPYGVLEGAGKGRRHIKLAALSDSEAKHLGHYIDQAARLARDKGT